MQEDRRNQIRKLATGSVVATFALILVGGIVRLSDSGLGCGPAGSGTHGWPLCNGRFLPLENAQTVIEYSHRALAGIVTILVVLLAVKVWRHLREDRTLVGLSLVAVAAILIQAILGGLTVEENLHELLVGVHLALAMGMLALLLAIRKVVGPKDTSPASADRTLRTLVSITVLSLLLTIGAGGYMAGTQGHGRTTEGTAQAHMACGDTFPSCNGELLPFGNSRATDIHLAHRASMYLTSLLILVLFFYSLARVKVRAIGRMAGIGVVLLAAQSLLGGLQVWIGERAWLVFAHLLLATVLWIWLVIFGLELVSVSQSSSQRTLGTQARAVAT